MTIAVTGATGALGSLVLDALLRTEDPASLVAVVRNESKAASLAARGVQVRVADYTDPTALKAALEGVDSLLLISSSEVGQRLAQHSNVIEAAKSAGVSHVAYTSLVNATTSEHVLAPEHKATEELLAASGLTTTILRNNWYHENYLPNLAPAKESGILLGAAGDGKVAGAARRDYADAAAVVLTTEGHEGKVYELTGDSAYDYDELATAIGEAVGRDVAYQSVSADDVTAALVEAGLDAGSAGFVATLDANTARGDLAEVDPTLAELIGRPTTPLVESLRG
ncbi:NAD(P)H dehydrogenase (quinone) [Nocardioides daedukensis]|uniref:NAD(P)H dehydrogenase (Quinone) n=1 Tax=Nocardioides daedukensis TaxID=634462 RepID=A0A7Y9UVY4_9ACTN|nr:SDR family oxidoreductase [Nocardioides daedukensis]NYG59610.1 NAD(P)H dehydrogenase (quinone) [Nocardioides daedukensis]